MLLTALILTPLAAGLAGLTTRSHRAWEGLNLAAFGVTLLLGLRLAQAILAGPSAGKYSSLKVMGSVRRSGSADEG